MKVVNKLFELFGEFMMVALTGLSFATVVVAGNRRRLLRYAQASERGAER